MTRCRWCWGPQDQNMVWVGTYGDPLASIPGIWERCQSCGAKTQPIEVHLAPSLGSLHGPAVPTPEELLQHAPTCGS